HYPRSYSDGSAPRTLVASARCSEFSSVDLGCSIAAAPSPWSSLLLSTNKGHGGGLLHPRRQLVFDDIAHGRQLDAPRGLAHPAGRYWWHWLEVRATYEHQLHMADE